LQGCGGRKIPIPEDYLVSTALVINTDAAGGASSILQWFVTCIYSRSCIDEGYLGEGFPVWNHILGYVSHVFLCFVPTANFLVYCLVGNKFR
jgi:hypothetical protein